MINKKSIKAMFNITMFNYSSTFYTRFIKLKHDLKKISDYFSHYFLNACANSNITVTACANAYALKLKRCLGEEPNLRFRVSPVCS